MIGSRFVRYLKPTAPRHMPRLNQFMNFLDRKIDDATNRASYITNNGYGSRLLVSIIKLANLDVILNMGGSGRELGEYLVSIAKDLEKPIDVRNGKHTTSSLFIHSKTSCFELMTPSRRLSPLTEIPFHLSYNQPEWKDIRPLRICDMGTSDLRLQVHNEQLLYNTHGPTHVVYSLDCVALIAKFVAYYRSKGEVRNLDQCLLDFVHYDIITPTLLNDSTAIWLRNVYRQQLLSASPLESHTSTIWDSVNIDTIGSEFTGAMYDVQHLKQDLKNQSVSNQTVLSSLILDVDGTSFTSYYRTLFETATTPNQQPYIWVDCLRNLSWWEFILMVSSFVPDYPDVISLRRDIIRDIRVWIMAKPWDSIHGSIPYRTMIRSRLEGMLTYLNERQ